MFIGLEFVAAEARRIGPEATAADVSKEKKARIIKWQWAALALVIVVAGTLAIWNFYFRPPPIEPASTDRMAYPLPDKPSIAVLPFVNMSGDPEQEYIADGITESIITGLSKTPEMFVIARTPVFRYKGKPMKIRQVSEELGLRYILEGSVQKTGDRLALEGRDLAPIALVRQIPLRYTVLESWTTSTMTSK